VWILRAALPLVALAAAQAQFSGLSTTTNGGQVYFSSALPMRGTSQFLWPKIFRIDASGAALIAAVQRSSPVPPTNAYVLDNPQVSGDGRLLLYRGTLNCGCCSSCFLREQHVTTLLDLTSAASSVVGANAVMSRNGRYLATFASGNVTPVPPQAFLLIDRTTSQTLFQGNTVPGSVSVAADGTAVLTLVGVLQLLRNGKLTPLPATGVWSVAIDDGATTVLYETAMYGTSPRRLFVLNLATLQQQPVGPAGQDSYGASLSADGKSVTYLSKVRGQVQVFFQRLDGSRFARLTTSPSGILEATLSGDGNTVYAVSGGGAMLRIDTTTGSITTLVGPTPLMSSWSVTTPGSLSTIQGSGLENISVTVAGLSAPILNRAPNAVAFQMPWEVPVTASTLIVPEGGNPYFDDAVALSLFTFFPSAIVLGTGSLTQPVAIHADGSSLVTDDNPALPGEMVQIYFMGGGPVTAPVPTGVPTPAQPLSYSRTPISVVTDTGQGLDVSFFGLAPGLIGVWQMNVTIPANWSRPTINLQIEYYEPGPDSFAGANGIPSIPVQTGH